jgi:hypothetical protein
VLALLLYHIDMGSDFNPDALKSYMEKLERGVEAGLDEFSAGVKDESARRSDYLTGALSRSVRVEKEGKDKRVIAAGDYDGQQWVDPATGEHVDYALYRHENHYNVRSGEPKFIESTLAEKANELNINLKRGIDKQ